MITTTNIATAVQILRRGGLVAFPTETVYGLGGDATNEAAVERIFTTKERPHYNPLIVHLAHLTQLNKWARLISPEAMILAKKFWPGPLTMIFKKQPFVSELVTGGQDTVALRIPKHPIAQKLLQEFGGGIAAPSANKFTHVSSTKAEAVSEEFGEEIDCILDGGACDVGLESTIIDMSNQIPVILRPGMLTATTIENLLGQTVLTSPQNSIRAPGMHRLHYAPKTKTQLVTKASLSKILAELKADDFPVAVLGYSNLDIQQVHQIDWVQMPSEAAEYARVLYDALRTADRSQYKRILVEAVPIDSAWEGINDRLVKASAR